MSMRSTQGPFVASRAPTGVVGIAGTAHGPAIDIKPQFLAPTGVMYDPTSLSYEAASLQSSMQFAIDQKESMEELLKKVKAYPLRSQYVLEREIETVNDITVLKLHIDKLWVRLMDELDGDTAKKVMAALGYVQLTKGELQDANVKVNEVNFMRR